MVNGQLSYSKSNQHPKQCLGMPMRVWSISVYNTIEKIRLEAAARLSPTLMNHENKLLRMSWTPQTSR